MGTVIDLFAGAGGLSLGATRAGFRLGGVVELDKFATQTHKRNFPGTPHILGDVSALSGGDLLSAFKLRKGKLSGVIGGPPCQGFSAIGKKNKQDNRNALFWHFFRLVDELSPYFFLAENVPGLLQNNHAGLVSKSLVLVCNKYDILDPVLIKASEVGVPTVRTRAFFIGFRKDLRIRLSEQDLYQPKSSTTVTVKEALFGLPARISPDWLTEEDGIRKVKFLSPSDFATAIQNEIPIGVGDTKTLLDFFDKGLVSGCMGTRHAPEIETRYSNLRAGERDPISRSVRLDPNGFCPTLRAGTGSDRGSYQAVRPIHYSEPRVITPREAARLQGFPDWFALHRTKWHSFRQIGNSVSPMVAATLLKIIRQNL